MEISEYLTRINLKGADSTLFKREEKEVKVVSENGESIEKILGINSYTYFETGNASVAGFIKYEKEFPDTVFSIDPETLNRIMNESETIEIVDSTLIGKSKYGDITKSVKLTKFRKALSKYDNPAILLKNDIIQKIINRDRIVNTSYVVIKGDGTNLIFTLYPKMEEGVAKVIIPSEIITEYKFDATTFMEVLKQIGSMDVRLYLDTVLPEDRKKSPMKIEVTDKNAMIAYYVTEAITGLSSEPKKEKKKEVKEDVKEDVKKEDNIFNL